MASHSFFNKQNPNENAPIINTGKLGYCAHTVYFHHILKSIHKAAGWHSMDILLAMNAIHLLWDMESALSRHSEPIFLKC